MNKEKKQCPKCDTENKSGSHYCAHCGYAFDPKKQPIQKKKIMAFVFGLLVFIIGGIILSDFIKKEEPEQDWVEEEIDEAEAESNFDEENEKETEEEVFTYWQLPQDKEPDYTHSLTLGFSNTNKVEAEIEYASFYQGHYRYFLTVTEDEEKSDEYEQYYRIDEVEKVEYDLANSSYSFEREELNDYLDTEGLDYEIERFADRVRYTIYEPDLDQLQVGAIPNYPYDYILQQVDYAAADNDFFEDYLLFMGEFQLFPKE